MSGETAPIRNHPLRAALSQEMHVRRLPSLSVPCRLMQIVTLLGETKGDAARGHIDTLAANAEIVVPVSDKFAVLRFADVTLVWERHTEFATFILVRHGAYTEPFEPQLFEPALGMVVADMPGEVVRATQIALLAADAGDPHPADLGRWFASDSTIICDVAEGKARIISDFRLNDDGYGRLLLLDHGLERNEPAQIVMRLQELGNYRNMALLGLPLAQRLTPMVSELEARLATLTKAVSERLSQDDTLLDELTYLSAELARLDAETRYRLSATRAYAQISVDRLASLKISAVRGYETLADFTERRLIPAMRTCESFSSRLDDLSQRASWTSELLRTRIDIALAKQNRDLLHSMDSRTRLQLRLQQTVEGLSVVAISYYLAKLVEYLLAAVPGLHHDIAMAVTVPLVVAVVAFALWRTHARLVE